MDAPENKQYLMIINDAPYGSERPYNALRLAPQGVQAPAGKPNRKKALDLEGGEYYNMR